MSNSLRPHGLQPTRLLHPWDFPGKSTGVGCHCLLPADAWSMVITDKASQCKYRPWSQEDPHEYLSSVTYSPRDLSQASRSQVPQASPLLNGNSNPLPSEAVVRTKVHSTLPSVWWEGNAVEISLSACIKGKLCKK